jgi:hypothetical protein
VSFLQPDRSAAAIRIIDIDLFISAKITDLYDRPTPNIYVNINGRCYSVQKRDPQILIVSFSQ